MMIRLLTLSVILLLQGCGTVQMHPPIHPLAHSSIPDFPVSGKVTINNIQDSTTPTIIHSQGGTKYESNYKNITDTMVQQARSELARHGISNRSSKSKTIGLKVTHLYSRYIAFYWKGTITFTVTLGNGESFKITAKHTTGGGPVQDLSGSIADGVVALFKHKKVKAYLAR